MSILRNKRGSVVIFVMLFFLSLVGLIMAFVAASKAAAVRAGSRELMSVWSESILGEYDTNLREKYNIFGFYGSPSLVSEKINYYANQSFEDKVYASYGGAEVQLYDYSLCNTDMLRKQLVSVGRLKTLGKLKNMITQKGTDSSEGSGSGKLVIRNKAKLQQLPSAGSTKGITASGFADKLKNAKSAKGIIKEGSDLYLENEYIFSYFKDRRSHHGIGKTLFNSEIEYIICGKASEKSNVSGVKLRIIAAREALNMLYLLTDPEKVAEVESIAQAITPGPLSVATAKAIQAAWALVESNNDYKLLISGRKVPFLKDGDSWAIDFDSILANGITRDSIMEKSENENEEKKEGELPAFKEEVSMIDPGNKSGENYEDYLKLMLYLMDDNVKLLRIMDLIQLNMQYCYYDDFLIRDYNGGLKYSIEVNGDRYEMAQEYER